MTYDLRLAGDSSLLEDTVRTWCIRDTLVAYLIVKVPSLGEDKLGEDNLPNLPNLPLLPEKKVSNSLGR